ncbi:MAG: orotate phosphoribosyltransferase [Lentisphaerae bacterium]|nr:orotate phosphoribosyltransferase [Lentisphaerota bacterium]
MREEEVLEAMRRSGALLQGHFELRSGLHSDRFFQCANVLRYPRTAARLCAALAERMGPVDADAVIAPALGGIIVGHELARALDLPSLFAEKEAGRLVLRRFTIEPGRRLVVAEDVVTRGGRVQEVIDIVKAAGGDVAAVAVLVDRSGGEARFPCPTFSLLRLTPVTWTPDACPLCARGETLVHPGS